jgi:hypothetical protein
MGVKVCSLFLEAATGFQFYNGSKGGVSDTHLAWKDEIVDIIVHAGPIDNEPSPLLVP